MMKSSVAQREYSDGRAPKRKALAMSEDSTAGRAQLEELLLALLRRSPPKHLQMSELLHNDVGEKYAFCYIDPVTRDLRCETSLEFNDADALMQYFRQILLKGSGRRGKPSSVSTESVEEEDEETENREDYGGTEVQGLRIKIGEQDKIWKVYDERLKAIGQICLKKILKAWIREIHPQKQAKFPYNGGKKKDEAISKFGEDNKGDLTKPEWWPPTLRHREPDHQMKPERLALAHHLLRHSGFSADMFRKSTVDIIVSLDERYKESVPALLSEIYAVRTVEEQFERKELDYDAEVIVSKRYLEVQRSRPRPKLPNAEAAPESRRKKSESKNPEGTKKGDCAMEQSSLPPSPASRFTPTDPSPSFGANNNHDVEIDGHLQDSTRKRQRCKLSSTDHCPPSIQTSCFGSLDPSTDMGRNIPDRARHEKSLAFQDSVDIGLPNGDYVTRSFSTDFAKQAFFRATDAEPGLAGSSQYSYGQVGFDAHSAGESSSSTLTALSFTSPPLGSQPDIQVTSAPYSSGSAPCSHGFSGDWSVKCPGCEIFTEFYNSGNFDVQYQSRFRYENDADLGMEANQLEQMTSSGVSAGSEMLPGLPAALTPFAPQKLYYSL